MTFQLTRKYLEGEIESSKVALQKHNEGVRVHELVIEAFEKELKTLPEEKEAHGDIDYSEESPTDPNVTIGGLKRIQNE